MLKTTIMIAKPGPKESIGFVVRKSYPSKTIAPQAAAGGLIPIPRKLRAASARIASPIIMVICTIRGGMQLGMTWHNIIRTLLAPMDLPDNI